MSVILATGLLLQVTALLLILHRIRHRRFAHIGVLFAIVAVVFHGLTEIAHIAFPSANPYRDLVEQSFVDEWAAIAGASLLIFALVYVWRIRPQSYGDELPEVAWWLPAAVVSFLYIARVSGGRELLTYWTGGLSGQFLIFGIVLSSFLYLREQRGRHFGRVILLQTLALALLGQRLETVAGIIALMWAVTRFRVPVDLRRLAVGAAVVLVVIAGISVGRLEVGREPFARGGLGERVDTLASGIARLSDPDFAGEALQNDFLYRFDGNVFPGLVHRRLVESQYPTVDAGTLRSNVTVAIPRFLWPNKVEQPIGLRDEESRITHHYGLPQIDFLPTMLGASYAYFGVVGALGGATLLGFGLAALDNRLRGRGTLMGLLLGIGFSYLVFFYERGLDAPLTIIRGVLLLALGMWMWRKISVARSCGRSAGTAYLRSGPS